MLTVEEYLADPQRQKQYAEWIKNPVTQDVIEMLANELAPGGLPAMMRTGQPALYYAGMVDTYNGIFKSLLNLQDLAVRRMINRSIAPFLANPDYGAQDIVDKFNKGDIA